MVALISVDAMILEVVIIEEKIEDEIGVEVELFVVYIMIGVEGWLGSSLLAVDFKLENSVKILLESLQVEGVT